MKYIQKAKDWIKDNAGLVLAIGVGLLILALIQKEFCYGKKEITCICEVKR